MDGVTELVEKVRAAILARKELAEVATKGEWTPDDGRIVKDHDIFDEITSWVFRDADRAYIIANQPSGVIRRCDTDLAILDEHAPSTVISYGRELSVCRTCFGLSREEVEAFFAADDLDAEHPQYRNLPWPCRTVRSLAEAYGITPEQS